MGKNRKNINSALAGAKSRIAAGLIVRGLALSGTFLITYFFAFWFLDSLLLFGYGQRYILNVAFFCALAALGKTDLFRTHEVPRIKAVLDTMRVY